MIYRIYPSKDATIYEDSLRKYQNTGKDEILEVGKLYDIDNTTLLGNSRALIQFDLSSISQSIVSGDITSPQYRLRMEVVEESEVPSSYDLYVFPVKEAWTNGNGSEPDTPHNTDGVSWVYRTSGSIWDTANSTVGKAPTAANIPGLLTYYDFIADAGNFEFVDKIKGANNVLPEVNVVSGALQLSASYYGGGTVNLSASFYDGTIYNMYFESNVGTLNGVDFRIFEPDQDGNATTLSGSLYAENITTNGTHSISFTASQDGVHLIQFTFFDTEASRGVVGSLDNIYIAKQVESGQLVKDEFNINGPVPSSYTLNEKISGNSGETSSVYVSNNSLNFLSSNYSGGSLNRQFNTIAGLVYTASFDLDPNDYTSIGFRVQEPDGFALYEEEFSSNGSYTRYFTAQETGTHFLKFSFFSDGVGEFTGSLDNLTLTTDATLIPTSSEFTDIYYDAQYSNNEGGGTWFTSSFGTGVHYKQTFNSYTSNLSVEVTDYINDYLVGDRTNNGFIVKRNTDAEESTAKMGSVKFFSMDTHTIYPPVLEVRWDDSSFSTGVLNPLTNEDIILYVKGLGTEYKETSKAKVRVYGRARFPEREFGNSPIKKVEYLPTTLYYSVVDAETEQVIIPFDTNYTKVSCDSTSNYFNFWFNGLQPERFYKFVFRLDQNGTTKYFDDNFYFKVVR